MNILTDAGAPTAYAEITNAVGSFGTFRNTLKFSTGLLNDRVEFSGRLAKISSEGYIDRASSDLKSYLLQGLYKDKNTLIKALAFGGHEVTYQSWFGVDPFTLENNRTYNFAGEIYEDGDLTGYYDNQVDNYRQDHYQLHWNQAFSNNWSSSVGLNYTYGRGYYEEYNNDDSLANLRLDEVVLGGVTQSTTDDITRKWLDNDFYVLTANAQYNVAQTNLVLGGMYSTYDGDHFGNLIWARFASNAQPNHEFYSNKGEKKEVSFFGKLTQKINDQWSGYVDLQFRNINYTAAGTVNGLGTIDIDNSFNFFNPKFGFTYAASENAQWYISYAKAQREPNRTDYENGNPRPEVLNDIEAGLRKKSGRAQWGANLYYMSYKDQLVLTGGIDDVGAPIRENVGDSYRLGIELDAKIALKDQWLWQPNLTLSQNKNKEFNFQRDGQLINLGDTNISYSPNIVAGSNLVFVPSTQFQIGLLSKYVGEQYMGNIDADLSKLSAYFINDLNLSYAVGPTTWAKGIDLSLLVNNIFNVQFESNGYFYTYDDTWSSPSQVTTIEGVGYYPQAGINFLLGATIKL